MSTHTPLAGITPTPTVVVEPNPHMTRGPDYLLNQLGNEKKHRLNTCPDVSQCDQRPHIRLSVGQTDVGKEVTI